MLIATLKDAPGDIFQEYSSVNIQSTAVDL